MSDLATASDRTGEILDTFRRLLRAQDSLGWRSAWELARDTGTVALPALERLWGEQRNPTRRMAVLAAIAEASGAHGEFLFQRLARSRATEERFFLLLCIALGPARRDASGIVDEILQRRSSRPAVRVAALAAGRVLELVPPDDAYADSDPGIAAAARFCRAQRDDKSIDRWIGKRAPAHHELVLCGASLGVGRRTDLSPVLEDEVVRLVRLQESVTASRCAAVCAARVLGVGATALGSAEDVAALEHIAILAESPEHRREFGSRLEAILSSTRITAALRVRSLVALVTSAPAAQVARLARASAVENPDMAGAFDLALARRLFAAPDDVESLRGVPSAGSAHAAWPALARGEVVEVVPVADARLARALALAGAGRLPPPAARRAVEEALWRFGWHPGRTAHEVELDFVFDLLLRGSAAGRALGGNEPGAAPYFPRGIEESDAMFEVAIDYHSFVKASSLRVPARHRLR